MSAPVKAETIFAKGDAVIYTPSCGGHEFMATVLRAHRDGAVTIEIQWAVTNEALTGPYFGSRYRIDKRHVGTRTAAGTPVGRVHRAEVSA